MGVPEAHARADPCEMQQLPSRPGQECQYPADAHPMPCNVPVQPMPCLKRPSEMENQAAVDIIKYRLVTSEVPPEDDVRDGKEKKDRKDQKNRRENQSIVSSGYEIRGFFQDDNWKICSGGLFLLIHIQWYVICMSVHLEPLQRALDPVSPAPCQSAFSSLCVFLRRRIASHDIEFIYTHT